MKSANCPASSRWSSTEMSPTQGAAHLPMNPSRQGRPERSARRYTPGGRERVGEDRSVRSGGARVAAPCGDGAEVRSPLGGGRRVMVARGTFSPMVITRYGYDLSSRNFTLNRGANSLIHVYSRVRA